MKPPHSPLRNPMHAPSPGEFDRQAWSKPVRSGVLGPILFGAIVLAGFGGGFGVWASSAPLEGAAIAPGTIVASGQNHRIGHLEGGIIEEVLVREGDRVEPGQPLIRLARTAAEASRDLLLKNRFALEARIARLREERDGKEVLAFPEELVKAAASYGLEKDLEEQRREFETRVVRLQTDRNIIDQRVAALQEQIVGLEAQVVAVRDQITSLDGDVKRVEGLVRKGLFNRTQYNALLRNRDELRGRIGQLRAEIGRAKSSIVEASEQKARLVTERAEQAVTTLNEARRQVADVNERLRAADDVLNRIVLRSPSAGVVVNIAKTTPGAVVNRGEDLMTILPTDSELIVEARLSPIDKDVVKKGQAARLRFSALNQRVTPEVPATVTFVSGDALMDEQTRESYYTMRLAITDDLPDEVKPEQIFPGMPVETYVNTGDRTFAEYMVKPIVDSFSRAFREE